MRRVILVLTVAAMVLLAAAVPALTQGWEEDPESWKLDQEPATPECSWFYFEDPAWDPWWEYWCWWRGWGWEFVFWVYD